MLDPGALEILAEVYDEPGQLDATLARFVPELAALIARADLSKLPADADSLRTWLRRAEAALCGATQQGQEA